MRGIDKNSSLRSTMDLTWLKESLGNGFVFPQYIFSLACGAKMNLPFFLRWIYVGRSALLGLSVWDLVLLITRNGVTALFCLAVKAGSKYIITIHSVKEVICAVTQMASVLLGFRVNRWTKRNWNAELRRIGKWAMGKEAGLVRGLGRW